METDGYLERINYDGELKPSVRVLSSIQDAHLLNIPLENLDIHMGEKIVLDSALLFKKIVTKKRF